MVASGEKTFKKIYSYFDLNIGERVHLTANLSTRVVDHRDWIDPTIDNQHSIVKGTYLGEQYVWMDEEWVNGLKKDDINPTSICINNLHSWTYGHIPNERRIMYTYHIYAMRKLDISQMKNSDGMIVGLQVCKCGFMNENVSTSAIINGNYSCYSCRNLWK